MRMVTRRGAHAIKVAFGAAAVTAIATVTPTRSALAKPPSLAACAAAFNPGAGTFLVVAGREADWSAAAQAAQALRKKKTAAEIAPATLFAGQAPGWIVLLGSATTRADADKLAASHAGAEVVEASLAAGLEGPPVKPLGKQAMPGTVWDVAGEVVTIVEGRDIATVELRNGGKPPRRISVLRGALKVNAHLAFVQKGNLFVLDEEAQWFRMVEGKPLGPLSGVDGRPPAEAVAGNLSFKRQHGPPGSRGLLVERAGKRVGLLHLGFVEPLGSDGSVAGLPFAKDDRLTVAYGRDLYRFEVLTNTVPARLVKICGKLSGGGATRPDLAPLRVTIGSQQLTTGADGRFETWTGDWGILRLGLQPTRETVISCGAGKKEYGPWNPGFAGGSGDDPIDVPLWDESAVSVQIKARCAKP